MGITVTPQGLRQSSLFCGRLSLPGLVCQTCALFLILVGGGCDFAGLGAPAEPPEQTNVVNPRVALDGNGFAAVSYEEVTNRNRDESTIRVQRYSFADDQFRDAAGFTARRNLRHVLAADESGRAIELFGESNVLRSCQFQSGLGWSCSDLPREPGNSAGYRPGSIAMDGAGRAVALDGSLGEYRLTPGNPWTVRRIFSTSVREIEERSLAYWSGGVAVAVWGDFQSNVNSVKSSRYLRVSDTWEPEITLSTIDPGPDAKPQIAMHRNGPNAAAIAVWRQLVGGSSYNIQANHYLPGVGWQGAQTLPGSTGNIQDDSVSIAMAGNGDVIVAWSDLASVLASRFASGSFGPVQRVGSASANDGDGKMRIAMDGAGNAILIWSNGSPLLANRYVVGQGWQGALEIGQHEGAAPTLPPQFDIGMDSAGRAMAVWQRSAAPFPGGRLGWHVFASGYTLSIDPTVLPLQRNGDSQRATVSIARLGYTGPIDLQPFDCPAKVICVFDRSQIPGNENTAGLTFLTNLNDPALAGNYVVRVTGTGGGATTEAFIEVQIQ